MDTNLSDLRYFCTVAKLKNLSKASIELGVTQPTLSQAIKRLEQKVEANLLLRSKKGVDLTQEGVLLYQRSLELLNYWNETQALVGNHKFRLKGRIQLGCHPSVALYSLQHFLPQFLKENPEVDIKLDHDLSRTITEKVIHNELDLGLVINPTDHPDLVKKRILKDEVCFWWNKTKAPQSVPLIYDPDLLQSKSMLKRLKIKFQGEIQTNSLENIAQLVNKGVGVGIIPSRVVKASGARLYPLKHAPSFKDELYLVYRFERKGSVLLQNLIKSITSGLREH